MARTMGQIFGDSISTMDPDRLSSPFPISVDKWGNSILGWLGWLVAKGLSYIVDLPLLQRITPTDL